MSLVLVGEPDAIPEHVQEDPDTGCTELLEERKTLIFTLQEKLIEDLARALSRTAHVGEATQDTVAEWVGSFYADGEASHPEETHLSVLFRQHCCDPTMEGNPIKLSLYKELHEKPETQWSALILQKMGFPGVAGCAQWVKTHESYRAILAQKWSN